MNILNDLEKILISQLNRSNKLLNSQPRKIFNLALRVNIAFRVRKFSITNIKCEKLLGLKIDSQFNFKNHVNHFVKNRDKSLIHSCTLSSHSAFPQRISLLNAFITSQFSYAPIVQMLDGRKLNYRVNKILQRALRLVNKDCNSSFDGKYCSAPEVIFQIVENPH